MLQGQKTAWQMWRCPMKIRAAENHALVTVPMLVFPILAWFHPGSWYIIQVETTWMSFRYPKKHQNRYVHQFATKQRSKTIMIQNWNLVFTQGSVFVSSMNFIFWKVNNWLKDIHHRVIGNGVCVCVRVCQALPAATTIKTALKSVINPYVLPSSYSLTVSQNICTVLEVDGATPKRWISKGPR